MSKLNNGPAFKRPGDYEFLLKSEINSQKQVHQTPFASDLKCIAKYPPMLLLVYVKFDILVLCLKPINHWFGLRVK